MAVCLPPATTYTNNTEKCQLSKWGAYAHGLIRWRPWYARTGQQANSPSPSLYNSWAQWDFITGPV